MTGNAEAGAEDVLQGDEGAVVCMEIVNCELLIGGKELEEGNPPRYLGGYVEERSEVESDKGGVHLLTSVATGRRSGVRLVTSAATGWGWSENDLCFRRGFLLD